MQQGGFAEVRVRFTAGRGVDFQTMTRLFVPVLHWDAKAGRLLFSTRFMSAEVADMQKANQKLDELTQVILRTYMQDPSQALSVEWLQACVENYHHPQGVFEHIPVADLFPRYVESVSLSDGTQRHYKVVQGMLERMPRKIYADQMTADDIDAFQRFLRVEVVERNGKRKLIERSRNTISSKLKKLRAVCLWAYRRKIMPNNPFDGYSVPGEVYGSVVALTIEERDKVAAAENLSPALAVQRDIFVFQCHVGCRISDLYALTHESVTPDGFIEYVARKTKRTKQISVRVPLDEVALQIVERYREADPVRLFPFISTDKYNDSIKKVLRQAGVDRQVLLYDSAHDTHVHKRLCDIAASHLARRTFSCNMFKATLSERITASMTGHAANSRAFARYSSVDDDMKRAAISKTKANPDEIPT